MRIIKWNVWKWYDGERDMATYIPCDTKQEVKKAIAECEQDGAEYEVEKVTYSF